MRRVYSAFAAYDVIVAALAIIVCAVSLAAGEGLKSLAYLAAGAWWLVLGRYWARRARRSRRNATLRKRRLERENRGVAPRRSAPEPERWRRVVAYVTVAALLTSFAIAVERVGPVLAVAGGLATGAVAGSVMLWAERR